MTSQREELRLRVDWLLEWPGHVTCVEPTIGSTTGAPDVSLVARSFPPGWVEFKAMDDEWRFKLRPEQRMWMRDFVKCSNRCAVVAMNDAGFYTFPMKCFLLEAFKPVYSATMIQSEFSPVVPFIPWNDIHRHDLSKLLEHTYV